MTSVPQFVIPGQTVEDAVLTSGVSQIVLSGGHTIGTTVNAGGVQLAGGIEDNTAVAGGGVQFVFSSSEFEVFSGLGSSLPASAISAIETEVSAGPLSGLINEFGGVSGFIKAIESGFRFDFAGVARSTTVYSGGIPARWCRRFHQQYTDQWRRASSRFGWHSEQYCRRRGRFAVGGLWSAHTDFRRWYGRWD